MSTALDRIDTGLLLVLAAAGGLVPVFLTGYDVKLATTIVIQAGLASALGLVVGTAGLVSLCHAAFYGLAGYLLAIMAPVEPANLLTTVPVAVLGAALFAALVGALSLRARGLYFILMTLAFGQLGYHFFNDTRLVGTSDGVYINERPQMQLGELVWSFIKPIPFYWLAFGLVCASVALCWWLRRSAFGSILIAARENETRLRAFGFSPYLLRLIVFIISGALAGLMGYLTAAQHGFVTPQLLSWHASAIALVMVLIGGKNTVAGPVVGTLVLLMAEEILQQHTEYWLAGVGVMVVAVVIIAPQGLVPLVAQLTFDARKRLRHA